MYEALINAQKYFFENYNLDITTVVSTGSLAFKLFRINFLNKNMSIPILNSSLNFLIRQSYFGGGVHVFKSFCRKVYHYDINSLYPFAMLKPMPFKLLKIFIPDNNNWSLNNDFFGFIEVEITISNKCKRILLPRKVDDKIIYKSGKFTGIYFADELKLYLNNPFFSFKYLKCFEFSKFFPFKDYVKNFYEIKVNSLGISRFIAKLLLNNLYGFFGRDYKLIKTIKLDKSNVNDFLNNPNINCTNIDDLDNFSYIKYIDTNDNYQIKSNVAIASAITSWARIIMFPFLMLPFVIYSDTDSIFTSKSIDSKFIGKAIGLFKDEMDGRIIQEAIFLGPKRYGYWFFDKNNPLINSITK